ncbi:class I SAM-dependent methyltransferase [Synechococcus sp. AH-551-A10]|nr:methyltransferase domain-containing protein [Synechococcus sp. AH-551-A10]MDB4682115.1 class I SAM-dependent methyltransferase [Synechococcus sp. AH-551-A10]
MDNFLKASIDLHSTNDDYGAADNYSKEQTMKYKLTIPDALRKSTLVHPVKTVLDYGTGKGGLVHSINGTENLNIQATGYDPAVKEFCTLPNKKFDIVTSIDVLEHIGRGYIHSTLDEISTLTNQFFFFCIDLIPASKKVKDGRNAHFLLAPPDWWCQQIKTHFSVATFVEVGKTEAGDKYGIHLFGCASHSMKYFNSMNEFIGGVQLANKQWIWKESGRVVGTSFM